MRLWSLHPSCLDSIGLVALWRESLLAQKVLQGKTRGYKNHPQLDRFREYANPLAAIESYLFFIYEESLVRGYSFDKTKFNLVGEPLRVIIPVTEGQVQYEFALLLQKLQTRNTKAYGELRGLSGIPIMSLFYTVLGQTSSWEKIKDDVVVPKTALPVLPT